jgi:hypothetical protein
MVFLLIVGVNFGRRRDFVRRNNPNFTVFQSAVKLFLCGTAKIISGRLRSYRLENVSRKKSQCFAGFPGN